MTRTVIKTIKARGYLDVIEGGAKIAAAVLTAPVLRRAYSRSGATPAEVAAAMPGETWPRPVSGCSTPSATAGAPGW